MSEITTLYTEVLLLKIVTWLLVPTYITLCLLVLLNPLCHVFTCVFHWFSCS